MEIGLAGLIAIIILVILLSIGGAVGLHSWMMRNGEGFYGDPRRTCYCVNGWCRCPRCWRSIKSCQAGCFGCGWNYCRSM